MRNRIGRPRFGQGPASGSGRDPFSGGISDAPSDGEFYGRQNGAWVEGVEEAPSDGILYGRQNELWEPIDLIEEAPDDGNLYGRQNEAWAPIVPGGGALTGDGSAYDVATIAVFIASSIPPDIDVVNVHGYYAVGDGGRAAYKRVGAQPTHPGKVLSSDGAWWEIAESIINVKMLGAKIETDGDATQGFQLAAAVCTALRKPFYVPSGTFNLSTITTSIAPWEGALIFGDGASSIIKWNDAGAMTTLFFRDYFEPMLDRVEFRHLTFRGTQDTNPKGNAAFSNRYAITIYNVRHIEFAFLNMLWIRGMGMVARGCDFASAVGCIVDHAASDSISFAACARYRVVDNRISFGDDDSIACHSFASSIKAVNLGGVISGNYIFATQGIKALGAVSVSITGNTLDFCFGQAISVGTQLPDAGTEAQNALQGVSITGNVIRNFLNRSGIDGLSTNGDYICIEGRSARAGNGLAVPGWNDPATGTVVDPYEPALNSTTDITKPIMPSGGISIAGNTLERTVGPVAKFSDYGYGKLHVRTGEVDPPITLAMFQGFGVRISFGHVWHINIVGNYFKGMGRSLVISDTAIIPLGISFMNNACYDNSLGCVAVSGATPFQTTNYIRDNIFDCDPYHKGTGRRADGSWTSIGDMTAILLQSSGGWLVEGNIFRNASRIWDINPEAAPTQTALNNICEGKPSVTGFSTANIGIGDVQRSPLWRIVEFDPNSANYRKIINTCMITGTVMPTTGTYVAGHIVRKSNPSISVGKTVTGWLRLTTGSGHVLDTDWVVLTDLGTTTLNKAGDTMTGNLTISKASPVITFLRPDNTTQTVISSKVGASLNHWNFYLGSGFANDDTILVRYDDVGASLGNLFRCYRLTGQMSIETTTASTSKTTGAFVVAGGVGVNGAIYSTTVDASGAITGGTINGGTINGASIGATSINGATIASGVISAGSLATSGYIGSGCAINAAPGYGNTTLGATIGDSGSHFSRGSGPAMTVNINADGSAAGYYRSGSLVGSLNVTTTSLVLSSTSDGRLKQDLKPFDAGVIIDAIQAYDFQWKSTGERSHGVVAQEVNEVYPECAMYDKDNDLWLTDYTRFVPVLLQELKSLRARVALMEQKGN